MLDAAQQANLAVNCLVDDRPTVAAIDGVPVLEAHRLEWTVESACRFLVAVGDNSQRARLYAQLLAKGGIPASVIHPKATVARTARIGKGTVILAGVVVNADAVVGENCILNTAASVDHDCVVGNHVHLCPGVHLAGGVRIGDFSMLGIGAAVLPGVSVGANCVVGAGAVVNRDLPDNVVACGVPARIRRRNDG